MLNPYLEGKTTKFNHVLASGKYLVILGLLTDTRGNYSFACFSKAYTTSKTMKEVYNTNDIDLKLYTDPNNNLNNTNIKQIQISSLQNQKEKYYDVGNETQEQSKLLNYNKFCDGFFICGLTKPLIKEKKIKILWNQMNIIIQIIIKLID